MVRDSRRLGFVVVVVSSLLLRMMMMMFRCYFVDVSFWWWVWQPHGLSGFSTWCVGSSWFAYVCWRCTSRAFAEHHHRMMMNKVRTIQALITEKISRDNQWIPMQCHGSIFSWRLLLQEVGVGSRRNKTRWCERKIKETQASFVHDRDQFSTSTAEVNI